MHETFVFHLRKVHSDTFMGTTTEGVKQKRVLLMFSACLGKAVRIESFMHKFLLQYDFDAPGKMNPAMQTLPLPKPADDMPVILRRR